MREKFSYVVKPGSSYVIVRGVIIAACAAGGLLVLTAPLALRAAAIILCASVGILMIRTFFVRYMALGVAQDGIVVGGDPLLYPKGTLRVPWSELEAVTLLRNKVPLGPWRMKIAEFSVLTVYLEVKPAAVSKYSSALRFRRLSQRNAPVADFQGFVIPTGGSNFDSSRFIEAVKCHASEVRIIELIPT